MRTTNFCKKYRNAARTILPVVKDAIDDAGLLDADIKMDIIKNKLGEEFSKKYSFTIYWGLKCGLFKEGYFAESYNNKEDKINIRIKKMNDKLPPSLDNVCNC